MREAYWWNTPYELLTRGVMWTRWTKYADFVSNTIILHKEFVSPNHMIIEIPCNSFVQNLSHIRKTPYLPYATFNAFIVFFCVKKSKNLESTDYLWKANPFTFHIREQWPSMIAMLQCRSFSASFASTAIRGSAFIWGKLSLDLADICWMTNTMNAHKCPWDRDSLYVCSWNRTEGSTSVMWYVKGDLKVWHFKAPKVWYEKIRLLFGCKSSLGLDVTGTGPLYTALGHTSIINGQYWMTSPGQLYRNK